MASFNQREIDFTDHGRPSEHPHQHRHIPNPTGARFNMAQQNHWSTHNEI